MSAPTWKEADFTPWMHAYTMTLPSGIVLELSQRKRDRDAGTAPGWYLTMPGLLEVSWLCGFGLEPHDVQIFALGAAFGHLVRVKSELADAARAMGVTSPAAP